MRAPTAALVVPALNEAETIASVVTSFRDAQTPDGTPWVADVVVVDNGSEDGTGAVAARHGATVVTEPRRGYGQACLAGLAYLRRRAGGPPDVVVFADADGACDAADLPRLVGPILSGAADMVLGARTRRAEPGALTRPQRWGNLLASSLIHRLYGVHFSDLGPYRAIDWRSLEILRMGDTNYGWTVEMQVKAARRGLRVQEVDVAHRVRAGGASKVSGTWRGVLGAGTKIIWTVLRHSAGRAAG